MKTLNTDMKYLPLYYEWMKSGKMPRPGLCLSLRAKRGTGMLDELFRPHEFGYFSYWASPNCSVSDVVAKKFNPLRQNIVLFMAAMNNEL